MVKREEAEKSRQDLVLREILREFFDRMEDLEVFIAQRNFEEAVELILERKWGDDVYSIFAKKNSKFVGTSFSRLLFC